MAQDSMFWDTDGTGDGADLYSETNWIDFIRRMFLNDPTTEGVVGGYLNELAVTGAGSPLSVNTGGAVVYGFPYLNDAAVALTVSTPAVGNTGGHVILRADWTLQTVRLVAVRNTDGNAATPALTQTPGVTYEIRLATFVISTLGAITLTDVRDYCHYNTALLYRRQGGSATNWYTFGSTNFNPPGVHIQAGVTVFNIIAGDISATGGATFPVAFGNPPIVWVSFTDATFGMFDWYRITTNSILTTGFSFTVDRGSSGVADVNEGVAWIAIGQQ